jgi:HK97 family phage major capsid protein
MRALRAWLEKATLTSADLSTGTNGGLLSPTQFRTFLRMVMDQSVLVGESRQETSLSTKFEVPRISLNDRLLRNGTEAQRLADVDRKKPVTGLVTLSTALFKGEVLAADEFFEDNVEQAAAADTLMTMIAEAVGRDVEEIAIKSDTTRTGGEDSTLDQFDGILKSYQTGLPAGQRIDASAIGTATDLFRTMIEALPAKYRRSYAKLRFYVPTVVADSYHDELTERGTPLGDSATTDNLIPTLRYRGVPIVGVPLLSGIDDVNGSEVDYSTFAWLTDPKNTIFGWHRRVRIERFRDPREGATSFLPTVRFDVKHADPSYGVLASSVDLAGVGS